MLRHELETLRHGILELHVAVHRFVCQLRDLFHDPKAFPDEVNAFGGHNSTWLRPRRLLHRHGTVDVEEHGIRL